MGLDARGVAVVGNVPAGLPRLSWPTFDPQFLPAAVRRCAGRGAGEFLQRHGGREKLCGEE